MRCFYAIVLLCSTVHARLGDSVDGADLRELALTGAAPACPVGAIADKSGAYCCPAECKTCGGPKCELKGSKCCRGQIKELCTTTNSPLPCFNPPAVSPLCPAGGILHVSGDACCPSSCGKCGGTGCSKHYGGKEACCKSQMKASCSSGKLPCLITDDANTPAGTSAPPSTGDALCGNGILGTKTFVRNGDSLPSTWYSSNDLCPVTVCCPKSCGACDMGDECAAGTPDECCGQKIVAAITRPFPALATDVVISCRYKGAPCVMPPAGDPCATNPCQRGARCGVDYYADESGVCKPKAICDCEAAGKFSGEFCELSCAGGESPCGGGVGGYSTKTSTGKTLCCSSNEDCLAVGNKYGFDNTCYSKDRPASCSECNVEGTENCYDSIYYTGPNGEHLITCTCKFNIETGDKYYEGERCEIKK